MLFFFKCLCHIVEEWLTFKMYHCYFGNGRIKHCIKHIFYGCMSVFIILMFNHTKFKHTAMISKSHFQTERINLTNINFFPTPGQRSIIIIQTSFQSLCFIMYPQQPNHKCSIKGIFQHSSHL